MAAIKYDVSDVEAGGGGTQPPPDLYKGHIVSMKHRTQKANGGEANDFEIVVDVGPDYARLWTYVGLGESTKWKMRELTDALGLPPKGSIDPVKITAAKPAVSVKVVADTDQEGEYRGKVKNLFKPGEAGATAATSSGGADGTSDEPWTEEELRATSVDELKAELEARSLKIVGRFSIDKAVEAILEDQETEPETEDEPEETSSAGTGDLSEELVADLSTDPDYYAEWSDEDLSTYINDIGIAGNLTGRKTRAKMVAHVVEFAESVGGDGGDDGEAAATGDDYDEWPENELLDEVNTRIEQGATISLTGRKTKDKLIAALRADDASSTEPF